MMNCNDMIDNVMYVVVVVVMALLFALSLHMFGFSVY